MSLRERLLNRPRPHAVYRLRVDDDLEARTHLEERRSVLRLLQMQGAAVEGSAVQEVTEQVAQAEEAVAACYEGVVLRALPPQEFEALVGKHKPREGTEDRSWNLDTFPRACLMACVESDLTESDWDQVWTSVLSLGEREALCNAAIRVNVRVPDSTLPKDWTQTQP